MKRILLQNRTTPTEMEVEAPERRCWPLIVWSSGRRLPDATLALLAEAACAGKIVYRNYEWELTNAGKR